MFRKKNEGAASLISFVGTMCILALPVGAITAIWSPGIGGRILGTVSVLFIFISVLYAGLEDA